MAVCRERRPRRPRCGHRGDAVKPLEADALADVVPEGDWVEHRSHDEGFARGGRRVLEMRSLEDREEAGLCIGEERGAASASS